MSILIRGMEMPQNCFDCLMSSFGLCNLIEGVPIGNPQKRLDNCPLIELPPHGRCIDVDMLLKNCDDGDDVMFIWALKDAPTIIEAEEE